MPHICHVMVEDFRRGDVGRFDERGEERYDDRDLGNAIIYCEDLLAEGETVCPSQGWDLAKMMTWAKCRRAEHRELLEAGGIE